MATTRREINATRALDGPEAIGMFVQWMYEMWCVAEPPTDRSSPVALDWQHDHVEIRPCERDDPRCEYASHHYDEEEGT